MKLSRRARRALAELLVTLRTEGSGPGRQGWSAGLGAFIGALPVYGLQLPLCVLVGKLLRLSRVTMYLAANLSNPLFAPFLIWLEIEVGSLLRRGTLYGLTVQSVRDLDPWSVALDLVIGSVAVGALAGLAIGFAAYGLLLRTRQVPVEREHLIEEVARPYLEAGFLHWEFVRSKLRRDPVYFGLVDRGLLPSSGRLVDVGCGRGILLGLLAQLHGPHAGLELIGLDSSRRALRVARTGLPPEVSLTVADAATLHPPRSAAILLLDVLHYVPVEHQDLLLRRAAAALEPAGVLLVREADRSPTVGFWLTAAAERLRAVLRGRPHQRFAYRTLGELTATLQDLGLEVDSMPMDEGTPFRNTLLVGRKTALPEHTSSGPAHTT